LSLSQICREFERFGKPLNVKVGNFFGGMDIKAQKNMLKDEEKCPDIVVGTPGRIKAVSGAAAPAGGLDHISSAALHLCLERFRRDNDCTAAADCAHAQDSLAALKHLSDALVCVLHCVMLLTAPLVCLCVCCCSW
jgi:hypothetical protein